MNIHRLRLTSLISLAILALVAGGQAGAETAKPSQGATTVVGRLQQHYDKTTSFSAKFNEEIIPVGGLKRARQGVVYYQRPGRMRWEFAAPVKELIVSDGTTLYDYQPDLDQVIEMPVRQAFRSSAATAFLLGIGNLERDFVVSYPAAKPSDTLIHVMLVPKDGGNRIELGLNPKTYDIVTLKLTDQLGNVTLLKFSGIRTDVKLDDKLFAFKVPPGADIVSPPSTH